MRWLGNYQEQHLTSLKDSIHCDEGEKIVTSTPQPVEGKSVKELSEMGVIGVYAVPVDEEEDIE